MTDLQHSDTTTLCHADLRAAGLSQGAITEAVRANRLLRPRQGVYLLPTAPKSVVLACTVGGRLGCIDALASWGVFARVTKVVHVLVPPHATRLTRHRRRDVVVHWRNPVGEIPESATRCAVVDALLDAAQCETERDFLASVDSALHRCLIDEAEVNDLFAQLPARLSVLRKRVDGSAESGSETHFRLLLDDLGLRYETQVVIAGVGRVDFVVEGWLIVECDSRAHHAGWEAQQRDRRRDLAAARSGYVTLRPTAADIFDTPDLVAASVCGLLETVRSVNIPVRRRPRRS